MITKFVLKCAALLLLFTVNSFSDAVLEIEHKENSEAVPSTNTNAFKGDNMKMDFFEAGSTSPSASMIFKGGSEEMINIDHRGKRYFVMDKQSLEALAGHMNQAMAEMEKAMAGMSPEERAMMEKMMGDKMPVMQKTEYVEPVIKQSGSGNVNGISCTKYHVLKGAKKVREICVAPWSNIEGSQEIKSTLLNMAKFMDEVTKSLSKSPLFSMAAFEKSVFNELTKLNGFPVQTIDYAYGAAGSMTTYKSSKQSTLDSSIFEPPAGYKQEQLGK